MGSYPNFFTLTKRGFVFPFLKPIPYESEGCEEKGGSDPLVWFVHLSLLFLRGRIEREGEEGRKGTPTRGEGERVSLGGVGSKEMEIERETEREGPRRAREHAPKRARRKRGLFHDAHAREARGTRPSCFSPPLAREGVEGARLRLRKGFLRRRGSTRSLTCVLVRCRPEPTRFLTDPNGTVRNPFQTESKKTRVRVPRES